MRNLAITFTSLQAVSRLKWVCEEFSNNVYISHQMNLAGTEANNPSNRL